MDLYKNDTVLVLHVGSFDASFHMFPTPRRELRRQDAFRPVFLNDNEKTLKLVVC